MCFTSLYYCIGEAVANLGIDAPDLSLNISQFDTRTRNQAYISPEQIGLGKELLQQGSLHNGKIDRLSPEFQEFMSSNRSKISILSDIYAIGSILFRILFGIPPTATISEQIDSLRLQKQVPDNSKYDVPFFAQKRILSNELCQALVHLLHKNPKYRY